MELRLDIGINQLIGLLRQLPPAEKQKVKAEIEMPAANTPENDSGLTELLLAGPTMTEQEEENFKRFNKAFTQWTKNLSA